MLGSHRSDARKSPPPCPNEFPPLELTSLRSMCPPLHNHHSKTLFILFPLKPSHYVEPPENYVWSFIQLVIHDQHFYVLFLAVLFLCPDTIRMLS